MREIDRYQNDKNNTPISIYLTVKTGGGSERLGLGRGIHWHIENQVYYLPTDSEDQDIPYVKVIESDGTQKDYLDVEAGIDPASIVETDLEEMDCITCHNRITHLVPPPEDTVDELLSRQLISAEIPDIRRQAVEVYSRIYDTTEKGLIAIAGIENYYEEYYPVYYASNSQKIEQAISALQDAYGMSVYPEQNSDWTTHPNNIGHKDSPGCFRCHDGKHLDSDGKAIRLECNLCHSIPVTVGPDDFVARIEISRGPEPQSHQNENWISLHNQVVDSTCSNCHTTDDMGGTSNTSFCSNTACHGSTWTYAGFDAPKLREILLSQLPPTPTPAAPEGEAVVTYEATIGPMLTSRCGNCHGENGMQGLDLTSYQSLLSGGQSGPAIIPGDPQASLLVQKQTSEQPHFSQLTPQELDVILEWISSGAPER
jgi:mono/diheme cytochrome c family protein